MDIKSFFSERIRLLREAHNLSLNQLADILGKKKSAISDIEAGRIGTTLDVLTDIANLFAVSTDWLLGRIDEPYSEDIISRIEDELFSLEHQINLSNLRNLIYFKAVVYFSHLKGNYYPNRKSYSLDQRADVVYAMNFWVYAANKFDAEGYDSQEKPIQLALQEAAQYDDEEKNSFFDFLKEELSGKCSSKRAGSSFVALCNECIAVLDLAGLHPPLLKPYYDIRKSPSE